jgi:hypothetical protein
VDAKKDWDYCSSRDPRFFFEITNGLRIGEALQQTAPFINPPELPIGCYDTIDGYFDPKKGSIYSYELKEAIRQPEEEEVKWIVSHCRIGIEKKAK